MSSTQQLPPFAISTGRYEQLIRETMVLWTSVGVSPERSTRTKGYARIVAKRTGRTVQQVLDSLS